MLHVPDYGFLVFTNKYQFSQKEKRDGLQPPSIIGDNHSPNAENLCSFPGGSSIKSFQERDGYFSGKLLHKQTSEEGGENERNCEKTTSHKKCTNNFIPYAL